MVNNLKPGLTDADLETAAEKLGPVSNAFISPEYSGYIQFKGSISLLDLVRSEGLGIEGKGYRGYMRVRGTSKPNAREVEIISPLRNVTESDVREALSQYGDVQDIQFTSFKGHRRIVATMVSASAAAKAVLSCRLKWADGSSSLMVFPDTVTQKVKQNRLMFELKNLRRPFDRKEIESKLPDTVAHFGVCEGPNSVRVSFRVEEISAVKVVENLVAEYGYPSVFNISSNISSLWIESDGDPSNVSDMDIYTAIIEAWRQQHTSKNTLSPDSVVCTRKEGGILVTLPEEARSYIWNAMMIDHIGSTRVHIEPAGHIDALISYKRRRGLILDSAYVSFLTSELPQKLQQDKSNATVNSQLVKALRPVVPGVSYACIAGRRMFVNVNNVNTYQEMKETLEKLSTAELSLLSMKNQKLSFELADASRPRCVIAVVDKDVDPLEVRHLFSQDGDVSVFESGIHGRDFKNHKDSKLYRVVFRPSSRSVDRRITLAAIARNGSDLKLRSKSGGEIETKLRVYFPKRRTPDFSRTVVAFGFPKWVTESHIQALFSEVGEVESISVGDDGVATVVFKDPWAANRATCLSGARDDLFLYLEKVKPVINSPNDEIIE